MRKHLPFTGTATRGNGRAGTFIAAAVLCLLTVVVPLRSAAQGHVVTGTVTDAQGPVIGASVTLKNKAVGTTTSAGGTYSITASADDVIVVSFLGYTTQEFPVGSRTNIDVVLETDAQDIEELVVIGYGVQKKSLVTGAISQVKGDALEKTGLVNFTEALAGKVAGVQIISDSGQPGAGVQMVIRGVGTNNSNGVNPLYVVDGMEVSGVSYLNPSDIESMEILKDAAATAIYGSRGANGVILITTKKGTAGNTSINFSYSYGISNLPRKLPLLSAKEYTIIRNEMSANAGNAPQFTDEEINFYNKGTDWQEAILNRNAPTQQYNISFIGGSDKTTYNLSGSYLDQNGIFAEGKSNYKRYTASFSGEQKFLQGDVLKMGQNVVASRVINKSITSNSVLAGPLTNALNMDPLTPVYDDYTLYDDYADNMDYYDLYHGYAYSRYMSTDYENPAALIHFANPNSYWTTVKANVYAELTFLKDFRLRGSVGADMTWTQTYSYTQPRRFNPSTVYNTNNSTSQSSAESQRLNGDVYLTWGKKLGGLHDVSAMAGSQLLKDTGLSLSGSRDGLLTEDPDRAYLDLAKGGTQGASGGPYEPLVRLSYFGRVSYAYDNRYLFTATIRHDGTSRTAPGNRFQTYPSVSVGWNVSNEQFMNDWSDKLNMLKLRVSWGQSGNDQMANFRYEALMSTSSQLGYVFGSNTADAITVGSAPTYIANRNLKWETTEQFNVGLDATLYRNWNVTMDYYVKTTKDLLLRSPIPLFIGSSENPTVNAGNVRNSGFEFMLSWQKTFSNGLYLSASGNFSTNKNEVTYVGNDTKFVSGMTINGIAGDITRMQEGYPMAYFRGYKVLGVFQNWDEVNNYTWTDPETGVKKLIQPNAQPGDLIYADIDGNGTIDSEDYTKIGNPYPTVIYGFNVNVGYKNFDLVINTSGASGHQVFSAVRRNMSGNNWGKWVLNRWTGEGTSNSLPRLTDNDLNGNWSNPSELYIQDADYFRIRNIALGYTYNFKPGYYIRSARVFVSVSNLFTFTKYDRGYDPEIGAQNPMNVGTDLGNYPRPRTVSFGVNLNF